jgi:hypothetical protein
MQKLQGAVSVTIYHFDPPVSLWRVDSLFDETTRRVTACAWRASTTTGCRAEIDIPCS